MHSSPKQVINCRNAGLSSVPTFDPNQHSSAIFHELTLAGNQIRSIPANAFRNVSIESLDLSDNPLSVIDPRSFSGLDPTLRQLFLSLSSDAPFPVGALASVRSVTVLHISGFSGRALPNGALYGLSALTELEIVNGGLMNIAADDFADQLFKLQRLSLSGNSLMSMPTVAIGQMMSLRSIDLSRNRIRKIGPKAFASGLIRLETIDLSNNGLGASVDEMAFVDVANSLTSIRMQHCQLADRSVLSCDHWATLCGRSDWTTIR
jgi:Leucine-rich repeat (LRR) protein